MIRTDPSGVAFSHFDAERRAKRPTTHRRRAVSTSKSPKSFPDHRSAAAPGGTILAMLRNATVRARRPEEVDECVAMLELVHAADGYPSRLPEDPRRWLTPADTVGAWVAADPGGLSGHVALHRPTGDAESSWVCTTAGLPPEGTALVARLSSRRGARGMGVGVALLRAVVREASARELRAALAVTDGDRAAMALYERCGWQHVGKTPWSWSGGGSIVLHCYLASD